MAGFGGLTVVSFESRRAPEMASILASHGARPMVAPSMREVPLADNPEAVAFAERLLAGGLDGVVFMTGVGTRTLMETLDGAPTQGRGRAATQGRPYERERIVEALRRVTVVARGPKPVKALREMDVPITITVPEPNTWREVLQTMEAQWPEPLTGARIAVQEYGLSNAEFLAALRDKGAEVMRVPVYRWALPEDLEPLRAAIRAIGSGEARVFLFTSSTQVEHLLQVAAEMGEETRLRDAMRRGVIASIGPICTEILHEHNLPPDLEPEHPRMGHLVKETADRAVALLAAKTTNDQRPRGEGARERGSERATNDQRPTTNDESQPPNTSTPQHLNTRSPEHLNTRHPSWDSPFMRACRREPSGVTPVWLMRQAGRYMKEYRELRSRVPFLELCKSPDLVAEVTVTAAERLGADAAIVFADILLIAEPLGLTLEFGKGEGPSIHPVVREAADVDRLREVDPAALDYVYEAVRSTRAALNPKTPLIGFAGAPFTLASYLIEGGSSRNYEHTKGLMYRDPGAWHALMGRIARGLVGYLNGQVAAGAQAIQLFDSWVGCLHPDDYREFVLPHSRAVIQSIPPGVPVIHFGTGTASLLPDMKAAGGDVIGLDWRVDLATEWARLGYDVGVQGNLDPVVLCADLHTIRRHARRILDQAAARPGHIFNLGHGILPMTPVENAVALIDMVHEISQDLKPPTGVETADARR